MLWRLPIDQSEDAEIINDKRVDRINQRCAQPILANSLTAASPHLFIPFQADGDPS